jgi:hypothetical protein
MPNITTRSGTPICGAARPTPLIAAMVSCMSEISACNSGVSKRSTSRERSNRRGSPIRSTGLAGMALPQLLDDVARPGKRGP